MGTSSCQSNGGGAVEKELKVWELTKKRQGCKRIREVDHENDKIKGTNHEQDVMGQTHAPRRAGIDRLVARVALG